MFENLRRGKQARNFTNVPKFLDLKILFRTDIFRKLSLGAPDISLDENLQNFLLSTNSSSSYRAYTS